MAERDAGALDDPSGPVRRAVDRCLAGDRDAFRVVVDAYGRMVANLVSRMVPQREEAEDLVQEIFLQAYRSLGSFRGDSRLGTWIYRIAVNKTLRRLSQLRRHSAASLEDVEAHALLPALTEESPLRQVCKAEEKDRVRQAIAALPDKQRLVVMLHYFEDLSCQEIAEVLGCSVGTVWSRLHYALRRLRNELLWAGTE